MEREPQEKCPVVPDEMVRLNMGEDVYVPLSANMDSIQVFTDPRYNHVRYYDPEDGTMKAMFLPEKVLADIYDAGIPMSQLRTNITQSEFDLFMRYVAQVSQPDELEETPDNEPHLTDAEIDYFFGEWGV